LIGEGVAKLLIELGYGSETVAPPKLVGTWATVTALRHELRTG